MRTGVAFSLSFSDQAHLVEIATAARIYRQHRAGRSQLRRHAGRYARNRVALKPTRLRQTRHGSGHGRRNDYDVKLTVLRT